jgi:RNA polymerase sigma factor for flagellar operon FliA
MEAGEQLQWKKFKTCKSNYSRDELIARYTNFVKVVAHEIYKTLPNTIEFADLESYGYVGLMDAIEKFNPGRNIKFETYAKFRIKGAIIDGLRKIDWFSRTIRDNMKKNNLMLENMQVLDNTGSEFLTDGSLDLHKNLKNDNINYVVLSYEDINTEGGDFFQYDETASRSQYNAFINPNDFVENLENVSYISKALRKLKDSEKKVVYYHYFKGRTFKEIGAAIGVSESRASQIHKKALGTLKRIMK